MNIRHSHADRHAVWEWTIEHGRAAWKCSIDLDMDIDWKIRLYFFKVLTSVVYIKKGEVPQAGLST
jgi:hypothetical protein